MLLDDLPITPNGKVDRRALLAPVDDLSVIETEYVAPQTEIEQIIVQIWQDVLQVTQVGIQDNFFDIGGHSLRMVQVHSRLLAALPVTLTIVELFQYPTIRTLTEHIQHRQNLLPKEQPDQRRAQDSHQLRTNAQRLRRRKQVPSPEIRIG